ncbi:MerR family transcriptional regulator [Nocardioides sp. AX2bis]|uniref:MerR family transcriptional regulator n=1 Tax=Nocardioides sp. AX2bis TaxID=2653157 RepID=UPI001F366413|nr:MerR family transcriptional regulator [Nocardioides sp. AX2bis]
MPAPMTIGEFARTTQLSVRTLRRYHDAGLLEPAHVDPSTGYRSYALEQVPTAQVIHQLRRLDVPLADVDSILRTADHDERAAFVAEHLRRLEQELDRTRAAVASLRRLLDPVPEDLEVELGSEPARVVAAVTATVDLDDLLGWYAGAMAELDHAVPAPTGPPGGLFEDALLTAGRGEATVYLPALDPPTTSRVGPALLPAVDTARTTHRGDHDTIEVTYARLGVWVAEHALAVAGPVRETYAVGPRDTADSAAWRTEIGWPVFRVDPAPG